MEVEMFNTLVGPLLFGMAAGTWGYFQRPEKREQLMFAMMLLFLVGGVVNAMYPSSSLFHLLVFNGLLLSSLFVLSLRGVRTINADADK